MPLYRNVALACQKWDTKGNLGLVVGATVPDQLREVRAACPNMPLLIPGVGAQGGSLEEVSKNGMNSQCGLLVNSSRGIIFASQERDFATKAASSALAIQNQMKEYLGKYCI